MVNGIGEFVLDIAALSEFDQVVPLLGRLVDTLGLKTAAYFGTGILDQADWPRKPVLAVTYSADWIDHYRSHNYVTIDPVLQIGLRQVLPLDWDDAARASKVGQRLFEEAVAFGVGKKGMSFPVHGHAGDRALLSLSADFSESEWTSARQTILLQMPLIAAQLHHAVVRTVVRAKPPVRLAPRELECLRWVAEGKTVWECAVILGLSEHTVKGYMETVRNKLGAASNTHAIALAFKGGLLFDDPQPGHLT